MAGAGKRTFIAGEVLTAAQVNDYLMDQAVMRFSGSAARAASITAPTEGMITYLDDTNRLEYYDGSAWTVVTPVWTTTTVGADGTVPTADSTQPTGIEWRAPSGAKAALLNVTASATDTAMSASLPAGYYSVQTSSSLTFTSEEFRFVGYDGKFYGFALSSGAGTFTIPVAVASVNVTKGAPLTGLVQEIPGVSAILEDAPVITNGAWTGIYTASFTASAAPTSGSVGIYSIAGSVIPVPASGGSALITPIGGASYGSAGRDWTFVQRDANGVWGVGVTASVGDYPYYVYNANGTYVPPPGSTSAAVTLVAGGGGGGGKQAAYNGPQGAGGGGGGGGVLTSTVPTPASVAITVGAAGNGSVVRGYGGGNSLFGSASAIGGGGGGGGAYGPYRSGGNGGSGGGAGGPGTATGGTATPGQGNAGGNNSPSPVNGAGGGGAGGAGQPNTSPTAGLGGAASTVEGIQVSGGGRGAAGGAGEVPATMWGGGGKGNSISGNFQQISGTPGRAGIVIVRPL